MRVLLINTNLRDDILAAPPIGVCYVAGAAERAGHRVEVLDLCFHRHPENDLRQTIAAFAPEVIGLSIRNLDNTNLLHPISYLPDIARMVQAIREVTGVPLVLGGSGASLAPQEVLEFLGGDFIVAADGEKSFVDLLQRLAPGESPDGIPGVGRLVRGEFRFTPPAFQDFSFADPQLGHWLDLRPYQRMGNCYSLQTKRGCRHRCIYCTYNQLLEGNRLRLRSPQEVVDEIEEVVRRYRPGVIEFVDSVFNDPVDHAAAILEEIVRRPWEAEFTAMGVSPKHLDAGFLDLMHRAGFWSFMITPESASPTMIRSYQKGFTVDDLFSAAAAINRSPFTVTWCFLIGGPEETNETLAETLAFIKTFLHRDQPPPYHLVSLFLGVRIYPGTRLWEIALTDGFITPEHDPLMPLWYLSDGLDVELAVHQLQAAASQCPEIMLGFLERYAALSKITGFLGRVLNLAKPYHRNYWGLSRFLVRTGLAPLLQPRNLAARLSSHLKAQRNQSFREELPGGVVRRTAARSSRR